MRRATEYEDSYLKHCYTKFISLDEIAGDYMPMVIQNAEKTTGLLDDLNYTTMKRGMAWVLVAFVKYSLWGPSRFDNYAERIFCQNY